MGSVFQRIRLGVHRTFYRPIFSWRQGLSGVDRRVT
jgi:hypothetical protein